MDENESSLFRILRISILFPLEELVLAMQQPKHFASVSLLLFILSIDAIKLINENILT